MAENLKSPSSNSIQHFNNFALDTQHISSSQCGWQPFPVNAQGSYKGMEEECLSSLPQDVSLPALTMES